MYIIEKIKKNRVVKNAGWLIGGNIAQKIVAFIVSIWMARYLGPGNYGLINYAAAYVTFFYSLATLGINSILVKRIIDNPDNEGQILGTALGLQGLASLLSIVIIMVIVSIVDYGEHVTISVVFLSSLGLFFQELTVLKYWFQTKLESKYSAIATLIGYIISSGYKIILLVLNKNVEWFALATSIDYFCIAFILYITYKKKKGPKLSFSLNVGKKLLKSSYPYILSGLMVSIYGATDKLMLKQMLNEEVVGYYGTAVSIANIWVFVLAAIIESLNPVIMELHNSNKAQFYKKNIQMYRIVFYLSMFVSFFITIFAGFGIHLLYGMAYDGAVKPLRIITWYVAFSYLGVARNTWVVCENQQKHLTGIYAGSAFINVILNLLLIPSLGAEGAALASLICQISTVFVVPLFIKEMRSNVRMMLNAILFID